MATPIDLADAVLQNLRAGACAPAFGDSYTNGPPPAGTMKFFGDFAAEVAEPYLIVSEPQENRTYLSKTLNGVPFIAQGMFPVVVFASSRDVARELADLVGSSLDDANLTWVGVTNFMAMRIMNAFFVPTPATGPGIPTTFSRVVTFTYAYQGVL